MAKTTALPVKLCKSCGQPKTAYDYEPKPKYVCLPCFSATMRGRRRSYHIKHNRRRPRKIEDTWNAGMLVEECDAAVAHANRINALQDQMEREPRADIRAEIRAKIAAVVAEYDKATGGGQ